MIKPQHKQHNTKERANPSFPYLEKQASGILWHTHTQWARLS